MGNLCAAPQQVEDRNVDREFSGVGVAGALQAGQAVDDGETDSAPDQDIQRPRTKAEMKRKRSPSALRVGNLYKLCLGGRGQAEWKERFFELEGATLRYYSRRALRGVVILTGCSLEHDDRELTIAVTKPGRSSPIITVRCNAKADHTNWVAVLQSAATADAKSSARTKGTRNKVHRQVIVAESVDIEETLRNLPDIPKSAESSRRIEAALGKHFLFSGLRKDKAALQLVIRSMAKEVAPDDSFIIREGDDGDKFFVVEAGAVEFLKGSQVVGTAGDGAAFGELALMYNAPRAASVRATKACTMWVLDRVTFRALLASAAASGAVERVNFLRKVPLLEPLGNQQVSQIAEAMNTQRFRSGDVIIKQGQHGDHFYILKSGKAKCTQHRGGGEEIVLLRCGPGDYFGELALMNDEPRKANVIAETDCECYTLSRNEFTQLLGSLTDVLDMQNRVRLLRGMEMLAPLSVSQLSKIANNLEQRSFSDGEPIIAQGDVGEAFYIVFNGECAVFVAGKADAVATLSKGQYFGERALLTSEPRTATVRAKGSCEVFSMERKVFVQLLGPVENVLRSEAKKRDEGRAGAMFEEFANLSLDDFRVKRTLGLGAFGRVRLVEHKSTKKVMALKALSKKHVVQTKQTKSVVNERDAMQELRGFGGVVTLFGSFQDHNSLYFAMEIVPGGELWSALYNVPSPLPQGDVGGISAKAAMFYTGSVACALDHIHGCGFAYRDLKPENLLVAATGHLRVVDFGFAKKIPAFSRSFTLCGTPEYLAPELVLSKGHGKAVDLWALGIFLYELLVGSSPFAHDSQQRIFEDIIAAPSTLRFPRRFDANAEDLIRRLLDPNPALRLGMLKNGYDDIYSHAWFKKGKFNWDALRNEQLRAPWVPKIKSEGDTQFFDDFDEEDTTPPFTGNQGIFKKF